jgi:hypothetical protein
MSQIGPWQRVWNIGSLVAIVIRAGIQHPAANKRSYLRVKPRAILRRRSGSRFVTCAAFAAIGTASHASSCHRLTPPFELNVQYQVGQLIAFLPKLIIGSGIMRPKLVHFLFWLVVVLEILVAATSFSYSQERTAQQVLLRIVLESTAKAEFDAQVAAINPKANEQQRENVTNALKLVEYNRIYGAYTCMLASPRGKDAILACQAKFLKELRRFSVLISTITRERIKGCETRHRLFEAEIEFPPYGFLKGPISHLFDLSKFNECLTR